MSIYGGKGFTDGTLTLSFSYLSRIGVSFLFLKNKCYVHFVFQLLSISTSLMDN